jgi:hypothetical protein
MTLLALTAPALSNEQTTDIQSSPVSKASKINDIERDLLEKLNDNTIALNSLHIELAVLNDLPQPLQGRENH